MRHTLACRRFRERRRADPKRLALFKVYCRQKHLKYIEKIRARRRRAYWKDVEKSRARERERWWTKRRVRVRRGRVSRFTSSNCSPSEIRESFLNVVHGGQLKNPRFMTIVNGKRVYEKLDDPLPTW